MLRLDRIYVRGFSVLRAEIFIGAPWSRISDHAPLAAHLLLDYPGDGPGAPDR
jgi:endonuclease/exonuclease/phosphatase family metal-dependent hydrolase